MPMETAPADRGGEVRIGITAMAQKIPFGDMCRSQHEWVALTPRALTHTDSHPRDWKAFAPNFEKEKGGYLKAEDRRASQSFL